MSDKGRPPGLDSIARNALRQAAHLAIGLIGLPLVGIGLLLSRAKEEGAPAAPDPRPGEPEGSMVQEAPDKAPDLSSGEDAPVRAEVEAALLGLADATLPKRRSRRSSPPRRPAAPAGEPESPLPR